MLSQEAQRAFEHKYSHEKYMEIFGKNWLDDDEKEPQGQQGEQGIEEAMTFIDTGLGGLPF